MSTPYVCCLCGDIGFPDKLFRCSKFCNRLQHSYCSNYYDNLASVANRSCDWCLHEERGGTATATSAKKQISSAKRSLDNSDEKIIQNDEDKRHHQESTISDQKGKTSGFPSPRTANRRYKFLKDVLC
ncbi:hypothetical protein MKX03_027347 [Papaver bracteatum]|nr:hypothetical protein MKX03_027347 [Papaver bracteatum]